MGAHTLNEKSKISSLELRGDDSVQPESAFRSVDPEICLTPALREGYDIFLTLEITMRALKRASAKTSLTRSREKVAMRLLRLLIALLVSVTIASAALRAASDAKKPANQAASTKKSNDKKKKPEKPSTFAGEVTRVEGSKVFVKHANGTLKNFTASGRTKISGAASVAAITKGSMVTVQSTTKAVLSIQVTKLAPPAGPDGEQGGPVYGTITGVKTDAYGDTGTITVKTAKGKVHTFNCTNITQVSSKSVPPSNPNSVHTMQFLHAGQSVTVEHDSHNVALIINVH